MPLGIVTRTVNLMSSQERIEPEVNPKDISCSEQILVNNNVKKDADKVKSQKIFQGIHHGDTFIDQPYIKRSDLIEQVMRMTNDDRIVILFLDAAAGSTEILSATGRLLASPPSPFLLGSPLAVWVEPSTRFDENWRSNIPDRDQSLWKDLEFYRALLGNTDKESAEVFCCPYEEIENLRLRV